VRLLLAPLELALLLLERSQQGVRVRLALAQGRLRLLLPLAQVRLRRLGALLELVLRPGGRVKVRVRVGSRVGWGLGLGFWGGAAVYAPGVPLLELRLRSRLELRLGVEVLDELRARELHRGEAALLLVQLLLALLELRVSLRLLRVRVAGEVRVGVKV
jgi:hypothetical protein